MKKTLNTLNVGFWLWVVVAVCIALFRPDTHPVFTTGAITNATVLLCGRIIIKQLSNLRVEVQLNGKDVGNVEH